MKKALKKILVAPLDWGLGHAARCTPVIKELLNNEAEVFIAADKRPLAFLQKEFPHLETICFPGYEISYPSHRESMVFKMAVQVPKILSGISKENKWLQDIISEKKIDGVISDQRFGLYTDKVPCAFITHQVMVKAPLFENILYKINRSFIEKYSECWIPDAAGKDNLSGDLSHKFPLPFNAKFIGPLSRFQNNDVAISLNDTNQGSIPKTRYQYQIMAIISGPEPQRTIFEKIVLAQLKKSGLPAIIARGLAHENEYHTDENIEIHSHLGTAAMAEKITSSEIIISRPGYSTLMDLAALQKKAILVPTPGQTEQEYLARHHSEKRNFFFMQQHEFNLLSALEASGNFTGISRPSAGSAFKTAVNEFTAKC